MLLIPTSTGQSIMLCNTYGRELPLSCRRRIGGRGIENYLIGSGERADCQCPPHRLTRRDDLAPGMSLVGPAIVEEPSATTIVDAAGRLEVDEYGSLVIHVDQEEGQ